MEQHFQVRGRTSPRSPTQAHILAGAGQAHMCLCLVTQPWVSGVTYRHHCAVCMLWVPALCTALHHQEHCCTSEHAQNAGERTREHNRQWLLWDVWCPEILPGPLGFRTLMLPEVLSSPDEPTLASGIGVNRF